MEMEEEEGGGRIKSCWIYDELYCVRGGKELMATFVGCIHKISDYER